MKIHKYLVQINPGGAHNFDPAKFAGTIQWAVHTHTREFFGSHQPDITVTREEVPGRRAKTSPKVATAAAKPDGLDFNFATPLGALTPAQVDNLCLGLTHAFDATLWVLGVGESRCFFVELENQRRVAFASDCPAADVWKAVKAHEERPQTHAVPHAYTTLPDVTAKMIMKVRRRFNFDHNLSSLSGVHRQLFSNTLDAHFGARLDPKEGGVEREFILQMADGQRNAFRAQTALRDIWLAAQRYFKARRQPHIAS